MGNKLYVGNLPYSVRDSDLLNAGFRPVRYRLPAPKS
jgi:hypothetical protein